MNIIGKLSNGNYLIEISEEEWHKSQDYIPAYLDLKSSTLVRDFIRSSCKLKFKDNRVPNTLFGYLRSSPFPEILDDMSPFAIDGHFLEFDEWTKAVRDESIPENRFFYIRNFGPSRYRELRESIDCYLKGCETK